MAKEYTLNLGDQIPSFELKDQSGNTFSSDELYDAPAIIYFYPKDDTPGCTLEACEFRDSLERFKDMEVRVLGISPDSVESHQKFEKKYEINFTLLADTNAEVAQKFDVWQEKNMYGQKKMGIERSTFLIDEKGIIKYLERKVKVEGQVERLLTAVRDLQ